MHSCARDFRARCRHVPGFQKLFEKMFLAAVRQGPASVEEVSAQALKKLGAMDPVKFPSVKYYEGEVPHLTLE